MRGTEGPRPRDQHNNTAACSSRRGSATRLRPSVNVGTPAVRHFVTETTPSIPQCMHTSPLLPLMLLIDLPADVLEEICKHLPLAALLVFRLQTCRALRYRDDLRRLHVSQTGSLSLAQWQGAALELQRLGLARIDDEDDEVSGNSESGLAGRSPPPVPTLSSGRDEVIGWTGAKSLTSKLERLDVAIQAVLTHGPSREARLFKRVLAFVGLMTPQKARPAVESSLSTSLRTTGNRLKQYRMPHQLEAALQPRWARDNSLRTIIAASWYGISGEALVYLLRTEAALNGVQLVVKTERFDDEAWNDSFAPFNRRRFVATPQFIEGEEYSGGYVTMGPRLVATNSSSSASSFQTDTSSSNDLPRAFYVKTQVVAHLGMRAPAGLKVKGHGLSAGYPAFCFASVHDASSYPANGSDRDAEADSRTRAERAPVTTHEITTGAQRGLHIIFVGRFQLDAALDTEESFLYSSMRCGACQMAIEI